MRRMMMSAMRTASSRLRQQGISISSTTIDSRSTTTTTTTTVATKISSTRRRTDAVAAVTTAVTTNVVGSSSRHRAAARRSHFTYADGPGAFDGSSSGNHNNEYAASTTATTALEQLWQERDFSHRGFTVGIGGPVGSGKTATVLALCRALATTAPTTTSSSTSQTTTTPLLQLQLAVVTNDIFTQEDAEFLQRNHALHPDRIRAVETGGCPHAAIREDVSANLTALEELTRLIRSSNDNSNKSNRNNSNNNVLLLCESGGDNLAANFSRELADLTLYVIDVAGGDKVPRKGGPGITQSDLLIVNKTDLAVFVGADLNVMRRDADKMRTPRQRRRQSVRNSSNDDNKADDDEPPPSPGPTLFCAVKHGKGVPEICDFILSNFYKAMALHDHHHGNHDHHDLNHDHKH